MENKKKSLSMPSTIPKSELETFEKEIINKSSLEQIAEIMDELGDKKQ